MLVKFEQNRKVRKNKVLSFLTNIFGKELTPFWKTSLWLKQSLDAKQLIWRPPAFTVTNNYVSPVSVARLKVAPNMRDTGYDQP